MSEDLLHLVGLQLSALACVELVRQALRAHDLLVLSQFAQSELSHHFLLVQLALELLSTLLGELRVLLQLGHDGLDEAGLDAVDGSSVLVTPEVHLHAVDDLVYLLRSQLMDGPASPHLVDAYVVPVLLR